MGSSWPPGGGTPITAGVFNSSAASNFTYSSTGSAGAVTMAPGTYGNLSVNKTGAVFSLGGNSTVLGNLNITAGTLDASTNNYSLTVGGNWANTDIFNGRAGSVTLNGTGQGLTGSNTFFNFTKLVTTLDIFTLPAGKTTTIQGALTLQGVAGNPLALRSSTAGIQAKLTLVTGGTQSLLQLDVQDSDASAGQLLIAYNSSNSGNNLNWSFQTLDLNAGLLSYWKFDNDTADSKGTRNGALNGATFTTGKAPTTYANTYALSFNGSSNTMTASGSGLPAANAPQSFGLWAKPTSTIGALFSLWNAGSSSAVFLFANATVKNYARSNLVAGSAPSTGVWHYYAYTYDGTTHKIYIDGTLNASATTAADTATPNNVVIGNTGTGTDAPFNGTADDVRVYNRALSQTEVSLLSQQAGINGTGTLTLKNPTTLSTTTTNTATVTAALASLETGSPNATKYALSNTINSFPASVAIPGAPIASYSSTYTVPTGDGGKVVYAKITLSDSTTYTVTSNAITLDTVPPSAPTNLTLTANSDNTGFTATVTAPSSSDVTKLYWRYNVLDGNVAPSYPTSNASGTALGAGVTTGVTASSSQSITVTSMTQLKTYCVAVWAEDTAGNVSLLSAQNYLYLAPPTPRLVITAATSTAAAQAGGSTILTITAKDANNAVISTYAGPYTLTWTPTGGSATTLVSSSSSGWSGGATTASVSIGGSSAGTGTFNATDNSGTALTNGTLSFTWYPASFTVSTSSTSQVAGKGFTLTVTANDSAGSVVTPYVGTVSLTISATPTATDGLSVSSLSVTGAGVGSVTTSYPKWASAATITAKDTTYVSGVTIQGTGSSLRFNPDKFTVTVDPPPPSRLVYYLNELFRSVKVTALAADGTKLTNYQGTITFQTVSGLSLPSNYIFTAADGGLHEFTTGIMATTPGIYAGLTVSDTIATSAAGTSGPVTVIRAKVIIAYVDGPVGRLIVPVRIIDEVGNIIFGDSSTLLALTLTEGNPNGSATVPSLQIPFSSGELGIALTDTEAEKVRVGGSTSPVSLPIVEGVVTFGSSSTSQYSSSFQYIQFEQAPTSSPIGTYASQPLYAPSAGYVAQTSSAIPPAGSYSSPQGIAQYVSPANLTPAGRYDTGVSSGLSALQGFYAGQGSVAGSSYSPGNSSLPASSTISGYTPQAGFLGPTSNAPASYGQSFSPAAFQAATAGLPPSMVSAMQTYMTNKQTNAGSMNSYYGFYGPASFDRGSAGSSSPFGNFGMAGGAFMGQGTSPGTSNSNNAFSPAAFQTATAGLPPSMVSAMQSYMANTGRPVQVAPMSAYSPSATGNFGPPAGGGAEGNFSPTASWGAGFFGPANSSANADNAPSASSAVGNVQQGLAPIGPASFSFGNFEVPSSMNVAQGISAGQPGSSSPWGGGFSSGNAANPSEGMKVGNMPPWMEGFTPDTAHGPSWAEGGSHNNEEEKSGQGQKETSSQGQGNVAVGESTK